MKYFPAREGKQFPMETRREDCWILPQTYSAGISEVRKRDVHLFKVPQIILMHTFCWHARNCKQFNLGHLRLINQDQRPTYLHHKSNRERKWLPSCQHQPVNSWKCAGATPVYPAFFRSLLTACLRKRKIIIEETYLTSWHVFIQNLPSQDF